VEDGVRFTQDHDGGETGPGIGVGQRLHDRRAGAPKRRDKGGADGLRGQRGEAFALAEIDGIEHGRRVSIHVAGSIPEGALRRRAR